MPTRCSECGVPFATDVDPRRITCSIACRVTRKRRLDAERVAEATDLIIRQRVAFDSSDFGEADRLGREALRLLDRRRG